MESDKAGGRTFGGIAGVIGNLINPINLQI